MVDGTVCALIMSESEPHFKKSALMVGRSLITQLMLKMMTGIVAVRGFRIESEN